jgi:LPXTG-motif cell wall-anchored protein
MISQVIMTSQRTMGLLRRYRYTKFDLGPSGLGGYLVQTDLGKGFTTGTGVIDHGGKLRQRSFDSAAGLTVSLDIPVETLFGNFPHTSKTSIIPEPFKSAGFTEQIKFLTADNEGFQQSCMIRYDPESGLPSARCFVVIGPDKYFVLSLQQTTYHMTGAGNWRYKSVTITQEQTVPLSGTVFQSHLITNKLVFHDWSTDVPDIEEMLNPSELVGARVDDFRRSDSIVPPDNMIVVTRQDIWLRGPAQSQQSNTWAWAGLGALVGAIGLLVWVRRRNIQS